MTNATVAIAPTVTQAIAELVERFEVSSVPTGDGGAIVTLHDFEFGERWSPASGDLSFLVAFNYPFAAIYPYYTTAVLAPSDNRPRPQALQSVSWNGATYTQISLRTPDWNPSIHTAALVVAQVEERLRREL